MGCLLGLEPLVAQQGHLLGGFTQGLISLVERVGDVGHKVHLLGVLQQRGIDEPGGQAGPPRQPGIPV